MFGCPTGFRRGEAQQMIHGAEVGVGRAACGCARAKVLDMRMFAVRSAAPRCCLLLSFLINAKSN